MKRFLSLLLALIALSLPIAACKPTPPPSDPAYLSLVENGATQYSIVYPANSDAARNAANLLCKELLAVTGVSFKPVQDQKTQESEYEILVGDTNRKSSDLAKQELSKNSFSIKADGKKLVLAASDDDALARCAEFFSAAWSHVLGCLGSKDAMYAPASLSYTHTIRPDVTDASQYLAPNVLSLLEPGKTLEIPTSDGYDTPAGSCFDGTYYYFAMKNASGSVKLLKTNTGGEVVATSAELSLGGAVSMCYNSFLGTLVVLHGGEEAHTVTELSADTLAALRTLYLPILADAIAYCSSKNQYIAKHQGKEEYSYLSFSFATAGKSFSFPAPSAGAVLIDIAADTSNVYALYAEAQKQSPTLMVCNTELGRFVKKELPAMQASPTSLALTRNALLVTGKTSGEVRVLRVDVTVNTLQGEDKEPWVLFDANNSSLNQNGLTTELVADIYSAANEYLKSVGGTALHQRVAMQGGCTDGKYFYFCMEDQMNDYNNYAIHEVRIVKYSLELQKVVKVSDKYPLHHCNDMTYNSLTNELVVVYHGEKRNMVTLIDADTLIWSESKDVVVNSGTDNPSGKFYLFSLAYEPTTNRYVAGRSDWNHFSILDESFNEVVSFKTAPWQEYSASSITTQGVGCDSRYIYFVQWIAAEKRNVIVVYDWEGNYCFTKHLPGITAEGENISVLGRDIYVGCSNTPDDSLYKITITDWLYLPGN